MGAFILPALIGGAASLGAGAIGAGAAGSAQDKAAAAYAQSVQDLQAIGVPSAQAQAIVMQKYQSAGQWTPQLAQAVQQGPSQMGNISTDPNLKSAQMQALSSLQNIGASGGMTLQDQAVQQQAMNNIGQAERGNREAILQHAQMQGGYGNGSSLAAQLMNQQNSAQNANAVGMQTAGNAQQRALNAIQGAGQLGGQMQSTQFGQQAQQAQAQDLINQWNAQNSQATQNQNVANQNQAGLYNLQNQQQISNSNTGLTNQQNLYNQQLQQQEYQNKMQQGQAVANARSGQANNYNNAANTQGNIWGGIGQGVAQAGAAASQMINNNDQAVKNRQAYGTANTNNNQG